MRHGSLFSGIGGFDLAAEWMGWTNIFHCEWNPFGQKVLRHYWPNATSYHDITKTDFTLHRGTIDILTGGFPCQPYSSAGKRKGKDDERHLWPHMLRAIREIQPTYVLGENVSGLLNWNGGVVFNEVQAELEAEGYEVQSFVLPACAVNAPHRRDRVWIVANASRSDDRRGAGFMGKPQAKTSRSGQRDARSKLGDTSEKGDATDANSKRLPCEREPPELGRQRLGIDDAQINFAAYEVFPTQPPICSGDDGLPSRLDGITFPKWRKESIKAYGNAIVPQVAFEIFKAIDRLDR